MILDIRVFSSVVSVKVWFGQQMAPELHQMQAVCCKEIIYRKHGLCSFESQENVSAEFKRLNCS